MKEKINISVMCRKSGIARQAKALTRSGMSSRAVKRGKRDSSSWVEEIVKGKGEGNDHFNSNPSESKKGPGPRQVKKRENLFYYPGKGGFPGKFPGNGSGSLLPGGRIILLYEGKGKWSLPLGSEERGENGGKRKVQPAQTDLEIE